MAVRWVANAVGAARCARSPKKPRAPALKAAFRRSRNRRLKSRESGLTGRKKVARPATHRAPSEERPPPGTTQWTWGMMRQCLTPGVQDGDDADLGTEPARVRGERHHRLGGRLEEDGVDSGLVREGDHCYRRRQREDDVEVGNRKEFGLARGKPGCAGRSLALRTVPVAARVIGDPRHAPVVAC